ncbi:hypothetical protein [Bartonella sp. B1098]|uniref:hypothetical protein n=1 Tax=Bartonella sp. B1098 TaxID=2911421 RepID=UPI0020C5A20B|nr:hypothetical protein [Bartonella sp. B1098]
MLRLGDGAWHGVELLGAFVRIGEIRGKYRAFVGDRVRCFKGWARGFEGGGVWGAKRGACKKECPKSVMYRVSG